MPDTTVLVARTERYWSVVRIDHVDDGTVYIRARPPEAPEAAAAARSA